MRLWLLFQLICSFGLALEVHGHRGSRGTHPESTLAGFEEALSAGADVLELDLQLTRDGTAIIAHWPFLSDRLCEGEFGGYSYPVPINRLSLNQIQNFRCGKPLREFSQHPLSYPATPMFFEQFLRWAAEKQIYQKLNIEIKTSALPFPNLSDFAANVVRLLERFGFSEQAIIQSFEPEALRAVRRYAPNMKRALLVSRQPNYCEIAERFEADQVFPHFSLVTKQSISPCLRAQIGVVPYTPNEEKEWRRLKSLGVKGLITDYPRRLMGFLGRSRMPPDHAAPNVTQLEE